MEHRIRRSLLIAAAVIGLAGGDAVIAGTERPPRQSLDAITERAIAFLRDRHDDDPTLAIDGGALDARLRLAPCASPLDAALAPGSGDVGRVSVQVRCPGTPGWRVHLSFEVSRERTVWTFARAARRGEILEPELLERTRVTLGRGESRIARAGPPVETLEPWLGQELARDVPAGRPLVPNLLAPRRLVERGAEVRLRAGGAGLAIETVGVALDDASLDERVAVRNRDSGRVVEAIVTGRGRAEILPVR